IHEIANTFRSGRPRKNGIHRHPGSNRIFSQTPRNRQLRGLRETVVNHFNRYLDGGFAGDKNDATPVFLLHEWQVSPAKPNPAQDIYLEESAPLLVADFFKWLWSKDTEIVHQDINRSVSGSQRIAGFQGGQIAKEAFYLGIWVPLLN